MSMRHIFQKNKHFSFRKGTTLLLALIMAFLLAACGDNNSNDTSSPNNEASSEADGNSSSEETLPVEKDDSDEETVPLTAYTVWDYIGDYTLMSSTDYYYVKLVEAQDYPALADSLEKFNNEVKASAESVQQNLEETAAIMIDQNESPEGFSPMMSAMIKPNIKRADSAVVSIYVSGYEETGGVHPMPFGYTVSYDSLSGKELELEEVVNDVSVLPEIISLIVADKIEEDMLFVDMEEYTAEGISSSEISWYMDNSGITFVFMPYEIAPYSAGTITATLLFAQYPELFNERYMTVPDSYVIPVENFGEVLFDNDGNGDGEKLLVYGMAGEYYDIDRLYIEFNGNSYEEEISSFEVNSYIVHNEDGKNYLYVETVAENDYRKIYMYDLSSGNIVPLGILEGTSFGVINKDGYEYISGMTFNPKNFCLGNRVDLLSTYTAGKMYHINEKGIPVSEDTYYQIGFVNPLVTVVDIQAQKVDEAGNVTDEDFIIKAGEELHFLRTNAENFVDFEMNDGSICRIYIDKDDWYGTINGMESYECFETLWYAG